MLGAGELQGLGPGVFSLDSTFENEFLWNNKHQAPWVYTSGLIDGAARDAGHTSNTKRLRKGLALGRVTTGGKLKEWSPTATDGTQNLEGFLAHIDVQTQRNDADTDRFVGHVLAAGPVKASGIIVPGAASAGLSGNASEHLLRSQMFGRFLVDDDFFKQNRMGGVHSIVAKTADYTVLESDNGTLFTTEGAGAAVEFTLPTTAEKGLYYRFFSAEDQDMKVTGAASTLIVFNNVAATSISFETTSEKAGGSFEVFGDGSKWIVVVHLAAETQTPTIA